VPLRKGKIKKSISPHPITPERASEKIVVKRKGNFNKLLVVKINEDFEFEARMLDRKNMSKGSGKLAKVSWSSMKSKQGS
jgi:hypothetical protein